MNFTYKKERFDIDAVTENKVNEILSELTLEEKVEMCHANSKFSSSGVDRLGISELTMSDGPHGVREEGPRHTWGTLGRTDDLCTYLPTGTALAATWNNELGYLHGVVLSEEARYRNKDIILGPGVNIIRTPLCGRNFEYMSEDPCLISQMVKTVVEGIQSTDTAACVKHFALNNQELDRSRVNVELTERALREIYLPGFKAAADTGAYSFMGAYNKYLNQHCCHNDVLVNKILKGEWNWDGVYLSDWGGTHDTKEAALYGLDIEMGTERDYSDNYLGDAFLELCKLDPKYAQCLDDKVRRILRLMLRINKLSDTRQKGSFNTKEHRDVAYSIASEAIVLLKNEKILPFDRSKIKKLLVVGENADIKHAHGGNSSGIKAYYEVTPLEGIRNLLGDENVEYIKSISYKYEPIPIEYLDIADETAGCRAFKMECFDNGSFKGEPNISYVDNITDEGDGITRIFTATLNIPEDGDYSFYMNADRGSYFYFNGSPVHVFSSENNGIAKEIKMQYKKGDRIEIKIKAVTLKTTPFEFLWAKNSDLISEDVLIKKAKEADAVIYCGGINHSYDTESFDKKDMKLHDGQEQMIRLLSSVNKNTVVSITAGSPVELNFTDLPIAVIWNWYAGMEGGNALADILFGNICPSGKMPFTLPKSLEDSPAHKFGEYQRSNCKYIEDIYVGYRGFEKYKVEPRYPFGHGLSYADFKYSNLEIIKNEDNVTVSYNVENTSSILARETSQVYIGIDDQIDRPLKELKGFNKTYLEGGEIKKVTVEIFNEDLKIWEKGWKLLHGNYTVYVGSSSSDIRLKGSFEI